MELTAALLLWLLCARRAVLDAVSAAVWGDAAGLLCAGVRLGGQRDLPAHAAGDAVRPGRACLPLQRRVALTADGVLLHLWGYSFQSDLVRHGDGAGLLLHAGACIRKQADQTGAGAAVFPHRRAVLYRFGILLWTAGCFWRNDALTSPAFWCDILLTLAISALLPAVRKAVRV